ncbi:MAG: hypothetical protein LLG04_14905 [Parachlamydia sp.]|nr:hypothetical protein [Parachlamydia sp.]
MKTYRLYILSIGILLCSMALLKASDERSDEGEIARRGGGARAGGARVGGARAGVGVGARGRAVGYGRVGGYSRAGAYAAGYRRGGYAGSAAYYPTTSTYYYPTTPYYTQSYPYY